MDTARTDTLGTGTARPLVVVGWGMVVLVAVLMLAFRGAEELGSAIAFAVIALGMGGWAWLRWGRAAMIASLALGALWMLQFAAYTVADILGDEVEAEILATDVIAVVAGALIVSGASRGLLRRARTR